MTLKEILHERYNEQKKLKPVDSDFDTFYNNESRKLTDIFKLLQLDEWTEKLKSNGEYQFSQEGAKFVSKLFDEYSGKYAKLDAIRRMDFKKFDSEFVEYLYYGFIKIFRKAGASSEELSQIDLKFQERLSADFHIARARYNRTKAKLDNFFEKPSVVYHSDLMEFLRYFAFEFEKFSKRLIEKMEDLAETMDTIRLEELGDNERLQNEAEIISQEEIMWDDLNTFYADKIDSAMDNDEELKKLRQEYASMQKQYAKKPPFQNKIPKTLKELKPKIAALEEEIRKRTIEEEHTKTLQRDGTLHENERFTLPNIKNPYTPSFENMLSSRDVLFLALKRLKEDDENLENDKDAPK